MVILCPSPLQKSPNRLLCSLGQVLLCYLWLAIVVAQVIPLRFPVDVHDLIDSVVLENLGKIL